MLPSRRNAYFQGFETLNLKDGFENAFKNHVFFGISIWKGFGEGFGRVLGGQNPRFSQFFRCFFEAFFKQRFGRAKNRKKRPKNGAGDSGGTHFGSALRNAQAAGRDLERGDKPPICQF